MKEIFLFIHASSLSEELGAEAPRFQESGRKPYGFRPYISAKVVIPYSAIKEKRRGALLLLSRVIREKM